MRNYLVTFTLLGSRIRSWEVSASSVLDAAFIATLNLVHVIEELDEDLLSPSAWSTPQALALQVLAIEVEAA